MDKLHFISIVYHLSLENKNDLLLMRKKRWDRSNAHIFTCVLYSMCQNAERLQCLAFTVASLGSCLSVNTAQVWIHHSEECKSTGAISTLITPEIDFNGTPAFTLPSQGSSKEHKDSVQPISHSIFCSKKSYQSHFLTQRQRFLEIVRHFNTLKTLFEVDQKCSFSLPPSNFDFQVVESWSTVLNIH